MNILIKSVNGNFNRQTMTKIKEFQNLNEKDKEQKFNQLLWDVNKRNKILVEKLLSHVDNIKIDY